MHSTEQDFLFRLSDINFQMSIFTDYLYFSELPPQLSYQLLTEEWKLGRHLALAMVSLSGGLVYDLYQAVNELFFHKSEFRPYNVIGYQVVFNDISECLHMKGINEDAKRRMNDTLFSLAIRGFATVTGDPFEDRIVRTVCGTYLAALVKKGWFVPHLPENIWTTGE
jgi:hypothetical protein